MRFSGLLFISLLVPAAVAIPVFGFYLATAAQDIPYSANQHKGLVGFLSMVVLLCGPVALIAVPVALVQLFLRKELRSKANIALVMVAAIPAALLGLMLVTVLFGHG